MGIRATDPELQPIQIIEWNGEQILFSWEAWEDAEAREYYRKLYPDTPQKRCDWLPCRRDYFNNK